MKMQKSILILLAGILSFPLFAAYQYEVSDQGIKISDDLSLSFQITESEIPMGAKGVFGYYAYNPETPEQYRFELVDLPKKGATGTIALGDFAAGEQIGFFIKKGNKIYDAFSLEKEDGGWELEFRHHDNWDITFNIVTGAPSSSGGNEPVGQPLPGILAALLIGGGCIGAVRMRRKKSNS